MPTYYTINEATARTAKHMMSFDEYKEGSATAEYRSMVDRAAEIAERQKHRVDPMYHEKIDRLLDLYARKLAENMNQHYSIMTRCPSIMIAGGSNFPVRKKEKQNSRRETLMHEYNEIQGILSKIKSVGTGPIDFSDPHAREMLVERVESAKALHESKKQANAYYRKHKTLDGCPGITEKDREWLTRPGVFAKGDGSPLALYGVPFPAYDLQRDTANIRSYAARLEEYDRLQARCDADTDTEFDGGRIVRNVEQNRLQILFDGKPDEEIRAALKSSGFRWSPKNQAWQRQLTRNAEAAARQALNLTAAPSVPAPEEQAEAAPQEIAPVEYADTDDCLQYSIPGV